MTVSPEPDPVQASPGRGLPFVGDVIVAIAVGVIAGVVYWHGSAPGVLFGDGGELQFAAWTAGLPHPTGYPLYMLLGWGWTHWLDGLGLATPARAMTLLSVLAAALAVGLTYLAALALIDLAARVTPSSVRRLAALLAAFAVAYTPTFWSQALVTEVYALHAALSALLLGLALAWYGQVRQERLTGPMGSSPAPLSHKSRSWRLLAALALAVGLSLTHHRTSLWLALILAVFVAWVDGPRLRRTRWPVLALLAMLPLLLYLYIPLRAPHTPYLTMALTPGRPLDLLDRSPAGLVRYTLGQSFAGELRTVLQAAAVAPEELARFPHELSWLGVGLALVGITWLIHRKCWPPLALTGAAFLVLTGFNLFYSIGDIQVFYIGPYLIACLWMAAGAAGLALAAAALVRRRTDETSPWPGRMATLVAGVWLAALPLRSYLQHAELLDRSQYHQPEQWWQQLLAAHPPANAALITNDRDEMMPLWYLQQVNGTRPDVVGLFPLLLPHEEWQDVAQVGEQALSSGRPVYLIKPMPGLDVKLQLGPSDPAGLTPVEGPAVTKAPDYPTDQWVNGAVRLVGYDMNPAQSKPGDTVTVDLYWQPVQPISVTLTSFVHLLAPDGETKVAQSDHQPGGVFYPTTHWSPGDLLLDRHTLIIPPTAPTGPYRLRFGMYQLP